MARWSTRVSPEVLEFEDARRAATARCRDEGSLRGFHGRIRYVRVTFTRGNLAGQTLSFIEIHETPEDKAFRLSWERTDLRGRG